MSHDTTQLNRQRNHFAGHDAIWLFGYGSLIWKADFPYLERRPAHIHGWVRRFWQGSHDHRGTPEAPGRVVTLVREPGAVCHGMAYRITPEVLAPLDVREKNGYLREVTTLCFDDAAGGSRRGADSTWPAPTTPPTSAMRRWTPSPSRSPPPTAPAVPTATTWSTWRRRCAPSTSRMTTSSP